MEIENGHVYIKILKFVFQVRESPAPLSMPTPTPAPDHLLGGHDELALRIDAHCRGVLVVVAVGTPPLNSQEWRRQWKAIQERRLPGSWPQLRSQGLEAEISLRQA